MRAARSSSSDPPREMATPRAVPARSPALGRLAGHYLPDLVYGANDGIITTFAVVSGVVGAALSERVIIILGFANLVADGFSMGASNYLARRSQLEEDLADRRDALRHGVATVVGFVIAGVVPLIAYLVPLEQDFQLPARDRSRRRRAVRGRCSAYVRHEARPASERPRDAARRFARRRRRLRHRRAGGFLRLAAPP